MSPSTVAGEREIQIPSPEFTPEEVAGFQRDGYAIVRGMADASLRERMLQATLEGLGRSSDPVEYEAELHYPGSPNSLQSEGGRTVRRLKQAHSRGYVFTEWVARPELTTRLRQLLGPNVVMPLVHHNCIMTKMPSFSSDTGWHQDIRYWSFRRQELVNVWLALGKEYPENGCLRLIPGSHRMNFERCRFDESLFLRTDHPGNQELFQSEINAELEPGDVLFFHCRTFHTADRNRSRDPKFSVVFTFRPGGNSPLPGTRSASLPELIVP
ncbi:MAG: phytanoyl-CoA dioxygenase family protein [Planctomycetes bacterium]|nr:phytanoyl-CoA dioxygenase family protein [Planctomycetota bacterium]